MKIPMQIVLITLESGDMGVFIGRVLCPDEVPEEDCQVEDVLFSVESLVDTSAHIGAAITEAEMVMSEYLGQGEELH